MIEGQWESGEIRNLNIHILSSGFVVFDTRPLNDYDELTVSSILVFIFMDGETVGSLSSSMKPFPDAKKALI